MRYVRITLYKRQRRDLVVTSCFRSSVIANVSMPPLPIPEAEAAGQGEPGEATAASTSGREQLHPAKPEFAEAQSQRLKQILSQLPNLRASSTKELCAMLAVVEQDIARQFNPPPKLRTGVSYEKGVDENGAQVLYFTIQVTEMSDNEYFE